MRSTLNSFAVFVIGLMLGTATAFGQSANGPGERVTLRVDGLSCMFCAYGLEKNLKSLKGISNLTINVDSGTAIFDVDPPAALTDQELQKTVEDSGFTLRDIKRETVSTSSDIERK